MIFARERRRHFRCHDKTRRKTGFSADWTKTDGEQEELDRYLVTEHSQFSDDERPAMIMQL